MWNLLSAQINFLTDCTDEHWYLNLTAESREKEIIELHGGSLRNSIISFSLRLSNFQEQVISLHLQSVRNFLSIFQKQLQFILSFQHEMTGAIA